MLTKIRNASSIKKLILWFVLFLAMFIPMNHFCSNWMKEVDTNLMDFIFGGYGRQTVSAILYKLGTVGRNTYLHMIFLDCMMGILYLLFLQNLIGFLLKKSYVRKSYNFLLLFPLLAMCCDWTENLMTLWQIKLYPAISSTVAIVESIGTTGKFLFLGMSFISAIALVIFWLIK